MFQPFRGCGKRSVLNSRFGVAIRWEIPPSGLPAKACVYGSSARGYHRSILAITWQKDRLPPGREKPPLASAHRLLYLLWAPDCQFTSRHDCPRPKRCHLRGNVRAIGLAQRALERRCEEAYFSMLQYAEQYLTWIVAHHATVLLFIIGCWELPKIFRPVRWRPGLCEYEEGSHRRLSRQSLRGHPEITSICLTSSTAFEIPDTHL
jgi:hypothetical protein